MQFCPISLCSRNQKFRTAELLEQHAQKSVQHQLYKSANEYKVSSISAHKFFKILCPQNFVDIHTDSRHFLKMVKSCSGQPKTGNPLKARS